MLEKLLGAALAMVTFATTSVARADTAARTEPGPLSFLNPVYPGEDPFNPNDPYDPYDPYNPYPGNDDVNPGGWHTTLATCQSFQGRTAYCPVRVGGYIVSVRLYNRLSGNCVLGRTWGYDYRNIWVTRNCRAVFQVRLSR